MTDHVNVMFMFWCLYMVERYFCYLRWTQ